MAGNGHHNTSVINKLSQGKWVLETAAKPHCNTFKRLPNSSRRSLHVFFAGSRPLSYSVSMVFVGWTLVISPVFPWNLPMFFFTALRSSQRLMLTYDPNTRPSAGDLLTHKWLTASATAPVGRVAKAGHGRATLVGALAVENVFTGFFPWWTSK